MTRRAKITPERVDNIIAAMALGSYACTAATAAGINEATLYDWIRRGRAAIEYRDAADADVIRPEYPGEAIYAAFVERYDRACADAELTALDRVRRAGSIDPESKVVAGEYWQAAMTFLERRYPKRWARMTRLEHSGPGGKPIELQAPSKLTAEQLEGIAAGTAIVSGTMEADGDADVGRGTPTD